MVFITTDQLSSMLSIKESRFAFFVGAGISVPAGVPLATIDLPCLPSITREAMNHIFVVNNPGLPPSEINVKKWFENKRYLIRDNYLYGDALELLSPTPRGRMKFLRKFFIDKKPANTHLYLAEMLKNKVCDIILTTNFDDLDLTPNYVPATIRELSTLSAVYCWS